MEAEEVHLVGKEPCPSCGSRDNLARYSDGHAHCFSMDCGYREKGDGTQATKHDSDVSTFSTSEAADDRQPKKILTYQGEARGVPERKLREASCKLWQYRVTDKGNQIAYYLDENRQPVAGKVRLPGKKFKWTGDPKKVNGFYGQWLWPTKGKMIVVTEGEIDAVTVSMLQDDKWPVVSPPNGVQSAPKVVKEQLDFLCGYDTVVFMFDMDAPGQKAAKECAELLPPGKAKIASLPFKDANECLLKGKGDEVIRAMWNAKTFRPDGVISGEDLWDKIVTLQDSVRIPYPWAGLNSKTHGIGDAELVTLTAGSGIGKSAVIREVAKHLIDLNETVGMIMLEESVERTALGLMGIQLNTPLHISREGMTEAQLQAAFQATVGSGRCYLYDHFGSTEVDRLIGRVRYMAKSLDCRRIFLDHLSIMVSAMAEDMDERKLIDRAMTLLRTLVQETGISLFVVSHLKRPEGRGHEEGAHTSLSQLRGSHAIAQLSDIVIGLERNQQGDNPNETFLRVLKNRFSGETGPAGSLQYNQLTGRLSEVEAAADENGDF
ncbi:DnaB-like helicase C-terminal domain-containing protein [Bradyrhizobium sp. SZCCHNRI2049]|uniref:DnaB-like helicase C-terminal domain-containing protein n=1 Tax=Bradyrhizobium sp. SZCCHNRI2049 TaxID=3057287 RepID=UPI002915E43C|nr:DnaB-like helicase C-terminal domain-containing protein [Bradyrhizobium sp. SZCCHNRI2049]